MLPLDFQSSTFCTFSVLFVALITYDSYVLTFVTSKILGTGCFIFVYVLCIVYFYRFAFDSRMVPWTVAEHLGKKNIFQELVTFS